MKSVRLIRLLAIAVLMAGICGCAVVRTRPTNNLPVAGTPDPKGMSPDSVQQFEDVYPPN